MYSKSPIHSILVLAGVIAPPSMTPAARIARFLLQIVGIGFGIYVVIAVGLVFATITLPRGKHLSSSTARNGA